MQDLWAQLDPRAMPDSRGVGRCVDAFAPRGEGEGLAAFSSGDVDVAYTAAGYRPDPGFDLSPQRPAVYTPVALNAVVIAAMGGGQVDHRRSAWPVGIAEAVLAADPHDCGRSGDPVGQGQFFFSFSRVTGPCSWPGTLNSAEWSYYAQQTTS